ncbi:YbaN family protein [Zavarzinia compransoris]|uniref:DUF454 domain-containing protein n=1 Tax=Zavarzinia compransoris TaxID=1264899 RepID=A0A317E404_9PROT|nr:YbaN family protein [Zavarzinia compransoris]PWR21719.1 DUF454 domain-containing protein [Zavarzinia compransoris]TDP45493.1 hypothetical protein DES42_105198 [Zavarzinia compransoris]
MKRAQQAFYLVLGLAMTALGIIGAFLPVMPTTIFLILAAACFARSSPRLEAWLVNHPQLGPTVVAWRRHGAISRRGKALALSGMAFGYGVFYLGSRPALWLALVVAGVIGLCAAYVASRPLPPVDG